MSAEVGTDQSPPTSLRKKFLIDYGIKSHYYHSHLFTRVVEEFDKKKIRKDSKTPNFERTPEAKLLVANELKRKVTKVNGPFYAIVPIKFKKFKTVKLLFLEITWNLNPISFIDVHN